MINPTHLLFFCVFVFCVFVFFCALLFCDVCCSCVFFFFRNVLFRDLGCVICFFTCSCLVLLLEVIVFWCAGNRFFCVFVASPVGRALHRRSSPPPCCTLGPSQIVQGGEEDDCCPLRKSTRFTEIHGQKRWRTIFTCSWMGRIFLEPNVLGNILRELFTGMVSLWPQA